MKAADMDTDGETIVDQQQRQGRLAGVVLCACASAVLLFATASARGAVIVTDTVISETRHAQSHVPVTFGQVFKDGDVPKGASLIATLDGKPVTLQVDPKATNPDGSLRHAVITVTIPTLRGHAKLPLAISSQSSSPPSVASDPIGLSQLLATGYDTKISLDLEGKAYTASARALLQAADSANSCKPWGTQCNVWLSGPLASEWVVNGPVVGAEGTKNPNLNIYFAIRAYAGATPGTVGPVRTDIIVENDWAYTPQAKLQYTATLTSGSANYTSPALTQHAYTRWHKVLWWDSTRPDVYLQQDTKYIQNSMAVSRYMDLTPSERLLGHIRQSCAPLEHCNQMVDMQATGAQDGIGPLPRWTSVYIVDPDVRAYNWMLANTDALGAYSIHYRDQATGWPLSIQKHPYVTIVGWHEAATAAERHDAKGAAYRADLLPPPGKTGNPNKWNNAHQPAESYVPYMVTGSWYYMSELAFGASQNEIWSGAAYRGYSQGLIDRSHVQVRGKAWTLRNMVNAAWLLPDDYPLKAEFNADVENSLADWNQKYTNNPHANPLHVTNDSTIPYNGALAPWQHNFLTWSAGHAAELGFAGAAQFRDWLAQFEIGLMTDWQANPTHGYCWLEASAYTIVAKDSAGNWLPSYTAMYAATFPTLVGLSCNTPAMVAAMAKLRGNPKPGRVGEMYGYAFSATGYPANLQVALATAADTGLPNAREAWKIFESRSVKPRGEHAYNDYPNFALVPRSVPR